MQQMKDQPEERGKNARHRVEHPGRSGTQHGLDHPGEGALCPGLDNPGRGQEESTRSCGLEHAGSRGAKKTHTRTEASGEDHHGKQPGPQDWNIRGAADRSPGLEHMGMEASGPGLERLGLHKKEEKTAETRTGPQGMKDHLGRANQHEMTQGKREHHQGPGDTVSEEGNEGQDKRAKMGMKLRPGQGQPRRVRRRGCNK